MKNILREIYESYLISHSNSHKCPRCKSGWLMNILEETKEQCPTGVKYQCHNLGCGAEFTKVDYIKESLQEFGNNIDIDYILYICFYGVNKK